jgi:hypothetical protein
VTSETRDEVIASLLRSGLRGEGDGEAPPWVAAVVASLEAQGPRVAPPDTDELSAAAARLAEISSWHQAWLTEHQAALEETHRATGGAVADLSEFAHRTQDVRSGLSAVLSSVQDAAEKQRTTIARALSEATTQAQEQLVLARAQVQTAQEQMREFEEARAVHLEGLKAHVERYRRALRLTPTVAVSFVGVACVIAVVTSIVFVPSFQKFSEDEFVQRQVAPVVREEIKKSFEVLRSENEKMTKEFFDLEQARFDKFEAHYSKQIEALRGDKASLAAENQKLRGAYSETVIENNKWRAYAENLKQENADLKKTRLERMCGSIGTLGGGSSSLALFLAPLALVLLLRCTRRRAT